MKCLAFVGSRSEMTPPALGSTGRYIPETANILLTGATPLYAPVDKCQIRSLGVGRKRS